MEEHIQNIKSETDAQKTGILGSRILRNIIKIQKSEEYLRWYPAYITYNVP